MIGTSYTFHPSTPSYPVGHLDSTFRGDGKRTKDVTKAHDAIYSVLIQAHCPKDQLVAPAACSISFTKRAE